MPMNAQRHFWTFFTYKKVRSILSFLASITRSKSKDNNFPTYSWYAIDEACSLESSHTLSGR